MRRNIMLRIPIVGMALLTASVFAQAPSPETKESLEKKLKAQYPLTKLSADGKDLVTAGAVFTLKKDGLVLTPTDSSDVSGNSYKAGKITQSSTGKANEKVNKVKGLFGKLPIGGGAAAAPSNATRTFVAGEKLNITKIELKDGSLIFEVSSVKAYSDVYYHGALTFPVDKGSVPAADVMLATTGEVFSVDPPEDAKTAPAAAQPDAGSAPAAGTAPVPPAQPPAQAATPDPPPAKYQDIAPPPPPPPALELKLGQTVEEVVAQLGQPITKAMAGDKQIYLFKEWKVTFINGKVTDIDAR